MWHICHVQNILLKCSAKYFAGMRCVTSPEVWHHTWQNILLQYEQGPVFGFRPNVFDFLISVMGSLVGPILTNRVATAGVLLEPDRKKIHPLCWMRRWICCTQISVQRQLHQHFSVTSSLVPNFLLLLNTSVSLINQLHCHSGQLAPSAHSDTPKSAVQSCLHHSTSV